MTKFILGRKIEMTQMWNDKGRVVPATVLQAGPCYITQVKRSEGDGYDAVQIGWGTRRRLTKPMREHLKGLPPLRALREFRIEGGHAMKRGDMIDVGMFAPGDHVRVTGTSKGKGFQGVVKRHGFHGHPPTHGHKDQERMPGAIGAGGVQHVFKGTRMAGRMGGERVTVRGLTVLAVDKEKNRLMVKGAVPGARGSIVMIQSV